MNIQNRIDPISGIIVAEKGRCKVDSSVVR
jgi:hypothetical protein